MPSGAPKKKTQRGGKGKNAKVHAIVSSALVPQSVTKCLQETHHAVAPVAAPTSAPVMTSTVVGGPSHAPVRVPMTVTLIMNKCTLYENLILSSTKLTINTSIVFLQDRASLKV